MVVLAISTVLLRAPISIIASIIAVSTTAVSNRYLRGRPLPRFGGSYSLALGNN